MDRPLITLTSCVAAGALLAGCSPRNPIPEVEPARPAFAENGWPSVAPEYDAYEGTGMDVGDFMLPFHVMDGASPAPGPLPDQNNNLVNFSQFLGHVLVVDASSVWCGPCNKAAAESAEVFEGMNEIAPSFLVTLLVQNLGGGPATVVDAEKWASDYAAEYPVVVDTAEEATRTAWDRPNFPTFWFVAPTGEIFDRRTAVPSINDVLDAVRYAAEEWGDDIRHIEDEVDPDDPADTGDDA